MDEIPSLIAPVVKNAHLQQFKAMVHACRQPISSESNTTYMLRAAAYPRLCR